MSDVEYRAEWLSERGAAPSWTIITVEEAADAKAAVAKLERERDELRERLTASVREVKRLNIVNSALDESKEINELRDDNAAWESTCTRLDEKLKLKRHSVKELSDEVARLKAENARNHKPRASGSNRTKAMKSKIIQIVSMSFPSGPNNGDYNTLIALCEDGTLWEQYHSNGYSNVPTDYLWRPLPMECAKEEPKP